MTPYRLRFRHAEYGTTEKLRGLGDLADRVAVEQLVHELNPLDADGYVVTFDVRPSDDECVVAAGHFYVRVASDVVPAVAPRTGRD